MSKVKKIIIAALIFVVLAIVAMIPIPYVIESPGTAEEVSQFLTISGAKDEDPGSLRVLTVYVEQATVLTYFKKFLKHHEMVPAEEVFGDYTPEEFDALQDFSMRNARSKAVRVAFEAAGKTVERHVNGIFVTRVDPSSDFRDKLKVGDIIETIDGKSPGNTDESFEDLKDYPQNEVCILSSGDQGEPIEAMKNIAEKKIDGIQIESGDTIMIAATPSPNMEVMLFQTLNLLVKLGANVVTASKRLHAASHATKEELKMMLNMLMPKHFIPVQGEFRNLRKHAEIAAETGVVGDVEDSVLKDRKLLSNDGIFVASYAISKKEKTLVGRPVIQTKGFVYVKKSMELIKEAEEKIIEYLENNPIKSIRECAAVKAEIRSMLSSLLYDNTKRKPIIIINFSLI